VWLSATYLPETESEIIKLFSRYRFLKLNRILNYKFLIKRLYLFKIFNTKRIISEDVPGCFYRILGDLDRSNIMYMVIHIQSVSNLSRLDYIVDLMHATSHDLTLFREPIWLQYQTTKQLKDAYDYLYIRAPTTFKGFGHYCAICKFYSIIGSESEKVYIYLIQLHKIIIKIKNNILTLFYFYIN